MVYTMDTLTINKMYTTRTRLQDYEGEIANKVSRLYNAGNANNIQSAMRVFESLTEAGLIKATATLDVLVSGQSTTITSAGTRPSVAHVLFLGFRRGHPLNSTKIVKASFAIPAPINAIVNAEKKPEMTRGIDFATAADETEGLGAIVDWLENALTYETIELTNNLYLGGWTYSEEDSGVVYFPRNVGGSPLF